MEATPKRIQVDIKQCCSCGENHYGLTVKPLDIDKRDNTLHLSHYTVCPKTLDTIYIKFIDGNSKDLEQKLSSAQNSLLEIANKLVEINYIGKVKEFHRLFGHPIELNPIIPSLQRQELRYNLLVEEVKEFSDASSNNDIVEVADAFGDIMYVLAGAILEYGLGDKFPEIFAEVHRSNMSKLCNDEVETHATHNMYVSKGMKSEDIGFEDIQIDNKTKTRIFRKSDRKTLKSINYSKPNLYPILGIKEKDESQS